MKLLVLFLCVASAAAFTKRCNSGDDCEEGECCVNYILVSVFGGHCQKIREEGESCTPLSRESDPNPPMYHFQCPCREGFECVPRHELKIGDHIIRHRPECIKPEDKDGGDDGGEDKDDDNVDEGNDEIGEPEAE